jgi:predicted enzyme related to lactoylglutathione lyase
MPKQEVPDMGFYSYFIDPEGNVIGLWETMKKD